MKTTNIRIKGMTCLNCVTHVQKALEAVPGVREASVTLEEGARVRHDNANDEALLRAIRAAGDYHGDIVADSSQSGAITAAWLLIASIILIPVPAARAADHLNIEEGLPAEVEDAYPVALRGREVQTAMRYERTDDHEDRFIIDPRLEIGFAPNWQGKLSLPFYLGSADRTDSANVGLETLYNFNTEGLFLPAFALAARADFPTGKEAAGIDTTLKAIATRTLFKSLPDRIHLNLAWKHNAGARSGQRRDLSRFILGYSRPLDADTVLVADFVREQEIERKHEANIFEVGVRRQITPLTVISAGLGAGVGDESPDVRATLGLQKSF